MEQMNGGVAREGSILPGGGAKAEAEANVATASFNTFMVVIQCCL